MFRLALFILAAVFSMHRSCLGAEPEDLKLRLSTSLSADGVQQESAPKSFMFPKAALSKGSNEHALATEPSQDRSDTRATPAAAIPVADRPLLHTTTATTQPAENLLLWLAVLVFLCLSIGGWFVRHRTRQAHRALWEKVYLRTEKRESGAENAVPMALEPELAALIQSKASVLVCAEQAVQSANKRF